MRFRSKLLVILATFAMALTFAPVVAAGTQGSCSPSSSRSSVELWENRIGDTNDGDDRYWLFCNVTTAGDSDLGVGNLHSLPGDCNLGVGIPGSTWNDCSDSVSVYLPSSSYRACGYADSGYHGTKTFYITGPKWAYRINIGGGTSSVRVTYLLAC